MEGILGKLGRVSQSCRGLGWKEARESYRLSLEAHYLEYPIPQRLTVELGQGIDAFVGGDEHLNIRLESEPGRIFKITKSDQFGCDVLFNPHDSELTGFHFLARGNDDPFLYLKRWQLLNSISDYQTRFEGFIATLPGPAALKWLHQKIS